MSISGLNNEMCKHLRTVKHNLKQTVMNFKNTSYTYTKNIITISYCMLIISKIKLVIQTSEDTIKFILSVNKQQ